MPSEFAQTIFKSNLSTFYLLPLIYLNRPSFGAGNFIESYVNSSGTQLSVDIASIALCHEDCLKSPYLLLCTEAPAGYSNLLYKLPLRWQMDFKRFKAGKFSEFSTQAKHLIREYSGLPLIEGDDAHTDARLLALDKSPHLRKYWEADLGTTLSSEQELMPVPPDRTYRDIISL